MSQFDMFSSDPEPVTPAAQTYADVIAAQPEVLRPKCQAVSPVPKGGAELDAWTRETQRIYLLYLVGALARLKYRDSSMANARGVLFKLNGLGGQW